MNPANRLDGVCVTGIGLATPLGLNREENVANVRRLQGGVRSLTRFDLPDAHAAEAPAFDLGAVLKKPKNEKLMSGAVRLAAYAARQALDQSALNLDEVDRKRIAIHTGSGNTGVCYDEFLPALSVAWDGDVERDFGKLGGRASRLIDAYFSIRTLSNSGVGLLAAEHGFHGPGANFVQTDCASVLAIEAAAADLIEGRCDAALAGGYDSLVVKPAFLAYMEADLLSPAGRMAPFALGRDGIVLGESAAFFVLERSEHAIARGAEPLATLEWSVHGSDLEQEGLCADGLPAVGRKLPAALAGERPDIVVARGFGLREQDCAEAEVLAQFQAAGSQIGALKALTGYVGAATGATEIALTILCAREGFVPPAAPVGEPDPGLPFKPSQRALPLQKADPSALALAGGLNGLGCALFVRIRSSQ